MFDRWKRNYFLLFRITLVCEHLVLECIAVNIVWGEYDVQDPRLRRLLSSSTVASTVHDHHRETFLCCFETKDRDRRTVGGVEKKQTAKQETQRNDDVEETAQGRVKR